MSDAGTFRDTDPADAAREAGSRAARPRDAATLILTRGGGPKAEVLMGRRAGGHAFMPGKWVFPGGRVDRGDARAPAATELTADVEARLRLHAPRPHPRALALAAVRETWEEAGLRLARPAPVRPTVGAWRAFTEVGALPDLAALRLVGRAITPAYHPRRFDARFFMADEGALLSAEREAGTGELDEIAWFPMADALRLDLPRITHFVLGEAATRLAGESDRPAPFVRFVRGRRDVRWL